MCAWERGGAGPRGPRKSMNLVADILAVSPLQGCRVGEWQDPVCIFQSPSRGVDNSEGRRGTCDQLVTCTGAGGR